MPYKLQKARNRDLYWVVNKETKQKFSKDPIPRERAKAQMRALYLHHKTGGAGAIGDPIWKTGVGVDYLIPDWVEYLPAVGTFATAFRQGALGAQRAQQREGEKRAAAADAWLEGYYDRLSRGDPRILKGQSREADWSRAVLSEADINTILQNRQVEDAALANQLTQNQQMISTRNLQTQLANKLQRQRMSSAQSRQQTANTLAALSNQKAMVEAAKATSEAINANIQRQQQQQLTSQQALQRAMQSESASIQSALANQKAAYLAQQQERAADLARVKMLEAQQKYVPTMTTVAKPPVRLPPTVRLNWQIK